MNVESQRKKHCKKFKGLCNECGKQGHKARECWNKKNKPEEKTREAKKKKDPSKIKCFRCSKMGHFAKNCPSKNPETGMFVGMVEATPRSKNRLVIEVQLKHADRSEENQDYLASDEETEPEEEEYEIYGPCCLDSDEECECNRVAKKPKLAQAYLVPEEEQDAQDWVFMADTEDSKPPGDGYHDERKRGANQDDGRARKQAKRDDFEDELLDVPPPKWIKERKAPASWCIHVKEHEPGHPDQVMKLPIEERYKLENRPLKGRIGRHLYVTTGRAPSDVSVKTWKSAQKLHGIKPTKQPDRVRTPYAPDIGSIEYVFKCDGCNYRTRGARNGQFCPKCDDWRNHLWLEDQEELAHSDVYPAYDSEDYDTDDPENWLILKEQDADDEFESRGRREVNVADTCNNNSFFSFYPEAWLLDSGATVHITNTKTLMQDLTPAEHDVTIGDGSIVKANWKGTVYLRINSGHILKLTNVLFIPGFNRNILSLPRLLDHTCWIKGDNSTMALYQGSLKILLVKDEQSGMFYLHSKRITLPQEEECAASDTVLLQTSVQEDNSEIQDQVNASETTVKKPQIVDINDAHEKMGHSCEQVLRATCKTMNVKLTGTLQACEACMKSKARAKAVKKTTETKATKIGERLFLDTSGPFAPSMRGSKYWGKICDQFSGKTWDRFLTSKSLIPEMVDSILTQLKAQNIEVKFLRCDNAGEHQEPLQKVCTKQGVTLEYTAPNTPQHNGVVERRFVTDRDRAMAMMLAAKFTQKTQDMLRCEAISTASKIGDSVIRQGHSKSAYELFFGKPSPILPHLVQFGRIGFVTNRTPIKKKWTPKAQKCIMVGYADNHSADTYRMFNPSTKSILLSRDIKWADWHRPDPTADLPLYFDCCPGVDTIPLPPPLRIPLSTHLIPDDASITDPPRLSIGEEGVHRVTIEELEVSENEDNVGIAQEEVDEGVGEEEVDEEEDEEEEEEEKAEEVRVTQEYRAPARPMTRSQTKADRPMTRSQTKAKVQAKLNTKKYPTRSYFRLKGGDKVTELEEARPSIRTTEPTPQRVAVIEEEPEEQQKETICNTAIVSDPGEPKH